MNREIKFKAWIEADKKIYNVLSVSARFTDEDFNRVFVDKKNIFGDVQNYRIDGENKLIEFAGFKDRNNIDVFYGSILKVLVDVKYVSKGLGIEPEKINVYRNYEVQYRQDNTIFGKTGLYLKPLSKVPSYFETGDKSFEVIGNIYESPLAEG